MTTRTVQSGEDAGRSTSWRHLLGAAIGAIALAVATTPALAVPPLRALTWNIWDLPWVGEGGTEPLYDEQRWAHMARRILGGNYDIVVLTEVFNDGSMFAFREFLTDPDPHPGFAEVDVYNALLPDAETPSVPAFGQMTYGAYYVDGQADLGRAGLSIYSKFPPLPRVDLAISSPDYGVSDMQQGKIEHHCNQAGEQGPGAHFNTNFPEATYTNGACALAFHEFEAAAGSDDLASKGIGWLRVLNTKSGLPLNIFFTHTQADYPEADTHDDYSGTRATQWQEIKLFIQKMVLPNEDILLMGDLNVLGDGNAFLPGVAPIYQNTSEYGNHLKAPISTIGRLLEHDLFDAQFQDTDLSTPDRQRTDPGFTRNPTVNTNDAGDPYPQRLDYLMAHFSTQSTLKCPAHTRVMRSFDVFGSSGEGNLFMEDDLSDHWALEAVIGTDSPYCSPRKALANPAPGTHNIEFLNEGGYQWLWFPAHTSIILTAGSVVNAANQFLSSTQLEVFPAHDISEKVPLWDGPETQGTTPGKLRPDDGAVVVLPYDFYVRLRPTNPTVAGTSKILVTKPEGRNFATAIPLPTTTPPSGDQFFSNDKSTKAAMAGSVGGTPTQVTTYFRFQADQLDNGQKQRFSFKVGTTLPDGTMPLFGTPGRYAIQILASDGTTLMAKTAWQEVGTPAVGNRRVTTFPTTQSIPAQAQKGLRLVVYRDTPSNNPNPDFFRAGFTTNLRILSFERFYAIDQADDGATTGDDEPFGSLRIDGQDKEIMYALDVVEGGGRDFSAMFWWDGPSAGPRPDPKNIKFGGSTELRWGENDGPDGDYSDVSDYYYYESGPQTLSSNTSADRHNQATLREMHFYDDGQNDHYRVHYTVTLPK